MFKSPSLFEHVTDKYDVDWGIELGRGTFGTVYAGITRGVEKQAVAIKVLSGGCYEEQATYADAEARRYVALQSHPKTVRLLDVIPVRREGRSRYVRLAWSSNASAQTSGSSCNSRS